MNFQNTVGTYWLYFDYDCKFRYAITSNNGEHNSVLSYRNNFCTRDRDWRRRKAGLRKLVLRSELVSAITFYYSHYNAKSHYSLCSVAEIFYSRRSEITFPWSFEWRYSTSYYWTNTRNIYYYDIGNTNQKDHNIVYCLDSYMIVRGWILFGGTYAAFSFSSFVP